MSFVKSGLIHTFLAVCSSIFHAYLIFFCSIIVFGNNVFNDGKSMDWISISVFCYVCVFHVVTLMLIIQANTINRNFAICVMVVVVLFWTVLILISKYGYFTKEYLILGMLAKTPVFYLSFVLCVLTCMIPFICFKALSHRKMLASKGRRKKSDEFNIEEKLLSVDDYEL